MYNLDRYNITVRKGIFDGEELYEARVLEFPDVREYAETYNESYNLVLDTIETTARIFAETGREMPEPIMI